MLEQNDFLNKIIVSVVLSIVLTPLRGVWCSVTCGIEVWGVVSAPSLLCHLLSKTKLSYRFFSLRVGFLLLHLPLVFIGD